MQRFPAAGCLGLYLLAVPLAAQATVASNADDASQYATSAKRHGYVEGRMVRYLTSRDTSAVTKVTINRGKKSGVYLGATGVFFRGSSRGYLKDHRGDTVRFRVTRVNDGTAEAEVFQGAVTADTIRANARMLVRKH
jgi:serine/threonine-protein kinase RIO1